MSTILEKWGYRSFWDIMAFGAGLYGLGFSVANMVARMISVTGAYGIAGFTSFLTYLCIILLYIAVAFFPGIARGLAKRAKGGIMADEATGRTAILFLGAWTALFLSLLEPVNPWAHIPVLAVLAIILLAGRQRGKAGATPVPQAPAPAPDAPAANASNDGAPSDGIPGVRDR